MKPDANSTLKTPRKKWVKRLGYIALSFLILVTIFIVWFYFATKVHPPKCVQTENSSQKRIQTSPNSWQQANNILLRNKFGMYEMYIEGNAYERGCAHGSLTQELNFFQEKAFVSQIKRMIPSTTVLNKLKYFIAFFNRDLEDHITEEYKQEIYGVSQFASDSFNFIAGKYHRMLNYHAAHDIGHAVQDKNMTTGCTSFIIKGKKTKDGNMLLGRNFDFYSGDSFAKNKIVCFVNPDKGFKYAYVTWAGFMGVVSGMNEKGLSITINASKSSLPTGARTPISLLVKEILQYASNISEARKIANNRQTFVSESLLIASAQDKTGIIIEKSPDNLGIVKMNGDILICPNHFQSTTFQKDEINILNIKESSSDYRKKRMQQLLDYQDSLTPSMAANVLRNRFGYNNEYLGMGNEKNINQLICHHAVVMDPMKLKMYVSCNPFNLGQFICYDLTEIFKSKLKSPIIYNDIIKEDTFKYSQQFKNFLKFRELSLILADKQTYDESLIKECVSMNPGYYYTYVTVADYCVRFGKFAKALSFYKKANTLVIATVNEKREIESNIRKCREKILN